MVGVVVLVVIGIATLVILKPFGLGALQDGDRVVSKSIYTFNDRTTTTTRTYDPNGYLVRIDYDWDYEPSETAIAAIDYMYDSDGVLQSITNTHASGSVRQATIEVVSKDDNGRPTVLSSSDFGGERIPGSAKNFLEFYTYDEAGNITEVHREISYWDRDGSGAIRKVGQTTQYDTDGLIQSTRQNGGWIDDYFDPNYSAERSFSLTLPQDTPSSAEVDELVNLTGIKDVGALTASYASHQELFDIDDPDVVSNYHFTIEGNGLRQVFYSDYECTKTLSLDFVDVRQDSSFASAFTKLNGIIGSLP